MKNYFSDKEIGCKCCGKIVTAPKHLDLMNLARFHFGKPIYVNSWNRCDDHNMREGGSDTSSHLKGIATDIRANPKRGMLMTSQERYGLTVALIKAGFTRIFYYRTFIHVDSDHNKIQNVIGIIR